MSSAEGRPQGEVRYRTVSQVHTPTAKHGDVALGGRRHEVREQPGLPDPCLTVDHHEARHPGHRIVQGATEHSQLLAAADEIRR